MNEITRIHIAKVPYEIEVTAKKELETYLAKLVEYTNDAEVVNDIEIRITEILDERGVKAGGVIGAGDVEVLQSQIGSPEEIAGEPVVDDAVPSVRKLYRDMDQGLVAGVVAGLAAYFKIDVLLARIIFVLLTFITSGFLLLVYGVMWLMVPAASSAADKLRLRGRPVTVGAMADIHKERALRQRRHGEIVRQILLYIIGVGAVLGVFASLAAVAAASISMLTEGVFEAGDLPATAPIAFGLAAFSGVLLATLCGIVAYACFKRDFSRRVIIAALAVSTAGVISFSAAVGTAVYTEWRINQDTTASIRQTRTDTPAGFSAVTRASIDSEVPVNVRYVVSDQPSMLMKATPGHTPAVEVDGTVARITLKYDNANPATTSRSTPELTVYGPALEHVEVKTAYVTYEAVSQDSLRIDVARSANAAVLGSIEKLELQTADYSAVTANEASISDVSVAFGAGGIVSLGNIDQLAISYSTACPSDTVAGVRLQSVSSDTMTVNGKTSTFAPLEQTCVSVTQESDA